MTVTVTAPGSGRSHRRVRVHRSRTVGSDEVTRRRGLPVTTPARTLVDLARVLRPASLERATAEAVALGLTTPAELSAALHRHGGRPGAPKLRAALGGSGPALTRSEAEARFLELLRRAGVDPPEANVMVAGHELDFYWPRLRLAVEVDGHAYHSSHHAFERDRRRDAELVGAGVRVMRVTWRQITREPEALLVTLGGALSVASGPRGR